MYKILIVLFVSMTSLVSFYQDITFAIECPKMPEQANKDWEAEVNAAVVKLGPIKGVEFKPKVRTITNDLLTKLPDASWVYLEQMMLSAYCSALRDDKTIKESEKRKLLKEYLDEVRITIERKLTPPQKPTGKGVEKAIEKGHAKIIETQLAINRHFENCLDATIAFQNKKLEDLNNSLIKLYSQEVGVPNEEAGKWAIETIEKAREFKKELEKVEEKRNEYNRELSKNLIAKVYMLFDYIFQAVDSRLMSLQRLKTEIKYEKSERLILFSGESTPMERYTFRIVVLPNGNRILIDCVTGKLKQGIVSTCPFLEFIEIVEGKKMQSFKITPHYGGLTITIMGSEVQLKKERILRDVSYSATGEEMLTELFKDQFNETFKEFFNIAYAR